MVAGDNDMIRKGRLWRPCNKCHKDFEPTSKTGRTCPNCQTKSSTRIDALIKLQNKVKKQMKICKNQNCNNELKKFKKKYCSRNCQDKDYYLNHKEKYKDNAEKWVKKNPEKAKEMKKKSNLKFRTEKRKQFNKLMLKQYHKHKPKWDSRRKTYNIINELKNKPDIKKECKKCKSLNNLSLKFEVYPIKAKEIRQAIKEGKIYYLCKGCRFKLSNYERRN